MSAFKPFCSLLRIAFRSASTLGLEGGVFRFTTAVSCLSQVELVYMEMFPRLVVMRMCDRVSLLHCDCAAVVIEPVSMRCVDIEKAKRFVRKATQRFVL